MFNQIACRSLILITLAAYGLIGQQRPGAAGPGAAGADKATAAWWAQTTALANDGMEGGIRGRLLMSGLRFMSLSSLRGRD